MTSNREQSIQQALEALANGQFRSLTQAALAYGVSSLTLGYRRAGRKARAQIHLGSRRLTIR